MQATLICNARAGGMKNADPAAMQAALREAGFDPVLRATESEHDLNEVLANAQGLVVAAGGDGTVRAVARHLILRREAGEILPLAIVPLGTANNIGRALGLTMPPLELLANLRAPRRQRFDVGHLTAPWGHDLFLEAAGCGLYADALAAYEPREGKSVGRALNTVAELLNHYAPLGMHLRLDGQDLSGSVLLAEALNIGATGPRLQLAPDANFADGLLDVVLVSGEQPDTALAYARALLSGTLEDLPSVEVRRGRRLEIGWTGQAFHVDGEVRPPRARGELLPIVGHERRITVELLPGALELFLPANVPVDAPEAVPANLPAAAPATTEEPA